MLTTPISPGTPAPIHNAAATTGWECPRCHATYAPWMASCTHCTPTPSSLRDRVQAAQPPVPQISGPLPLMEGSGTSAVA